ncbi:MAG: hypothetical protein ACYDBS_08795, partial [Acidimicrobiales bacterium]
MTDAKDTSGTDPSGTTPSVRDNRDLREVILWWLGLSAVSLATWLVVGSLLLPRAAAAADVFANVSVLVFTALAIPVALFVWVFVGYSL